MPVGLGTGAAVSFGTSGFAANYSGIDISGMTRAAVPTSHLGTTTGATFIPGQIPDYGSVELAIQYDPDTLPPINTPTETVTITWPLSAGGTTAGSFVFSGFATDFDATAPLEDLKTGNLTIKITGDITVNAEA